jgi:hypothetical protein
VEEGGGLQLQLAEKLDGVLDHCEVTFLTRLGVPTAVRATATSGTVAAAASASDKSAGEPPAFTLSHPHTHHVRTPTLTRSLSLSLFSQPPPPAAAWCGGWRRASAAEGARTPPCPAEPRSRKTEPPPWRRLRAARAVQARRPPLSNTASLRDAESSLGDAESSLGDAKSSRGEAKSSLGDAESSLGDAESSLGGR